MLLLPRLDADAFVHEGALQISTGGISVRDSWSRKIAAAAWMRPEFELIDTGVFDENRYFDVFAEYAKASENDILIRITSPIAARKRRRCICCRRCGFGIPGRGADARRIDERSLRLALERDGVVSLRSTTRLASISSAFEGESHAAFHRKRNQFGAHLRSYANGQQFVKDAFHEYVVHGRNDAVNPREHGTKALRIMCSKSPRRNRGRAIAAVCDRMKRSVEPFG